MYKKKKTIVLGLVIFLSFILYGCSDEKKNASDIIDGINVSTSNEVDKYSLLKLIDFKYEISENNSISMEGTFKNISGKKIKDCSPRLNLLIPYKTSYSDEESISIQEDFISNKEDISWSVDEEKTFKSEISIDTIVDTAKDINCEYIKSIEDAKQIIEKKEFSFSYAYNYTQWFKLIQIQGNSNAENIEFSEQVYFMGL